jgi:hypothetical protein
MIDQNRIIAQLLQMLADLGWMAPRGDVIDQLIAGGLLTSAQAEDVAGRDRDTITRWNRDAIDEGRSPLGIYSPAGWLWGTDRLLDCIELKRGLYTRNEAETRAKKYADVWSQPLQQLQQRKSTS